jgi:hypothetical protein
VASRLPACVCDYRPKHRAVIRSRHGPGKLAGGGGVDPNTVAEPGYGLPRGDRSVDSQLQALAHERGATPGSWPQHWSSRVRIRLWRWSGCRRDHRPVGVDRFDKKVAEESINRVKLERRRQRSLLEIRTVVPVLTANVVAEFDDMATGESIGHGSRHFRGRERDGTGGKRLRHYIRYGRSAECADSHQRKQAPQVRDGMKRSIAIHSKSCERPRLVASSLQATGSETVTHPGFHSAGAYVITLWSGIIADTPPTPTTSPQDPLHSPRHRD